MKTQHIYLEKRKHNKQRANFLDFSTVKGIFRTLSNFYYRREAYTRGNNKISNFNLAISTFLLI